MVVLGIETSCDETAAAVVESGRVVHANVVSSQIEMHRQYGGVVPELASRAHLEAAIPIVELTLERAGLQLADVDAIAVTCGPGLVGALMVGVQVAKGLALASGKPLVGVHHIAAHIYAVQLHERGASGHVPVPYPHVALTVSGGHTALYRVDGPLAITELGRTLDDAAGEAFDKVALMLGLGYPGGRIIDEMARGGRVDAYAFPRAFLGKRKADFSFSGLKTSVRTHLRKCGAPDAAGLPDLLASFQEAIVQVLVSKAITAATDQGVDHVVVAGGVGANSRLRGQLDAQCRRKGLTAHLTPLRYCTDNAAMIAGHGHVLLESGRRADPRTLDADSALCIA